MLAKSILQAVVGDRYHVLTAQRAGIETDYDSGANGVVTHAFNRALLSIDRHRVVLGIAGAGGGIRAGQMLGENEELGCFPVTPPLHVHDIQATLLHLLGLDHKRLTYHFQGRDFRLTDVGGQVVQELVS